ncbi:MAG: methyl-accepting chemotaxis protein [Rubrivivax sp.]
MYLLNNLRLAPRMAFGFGSVLLMLAVVVTLAAVRFRAVDAATDALVNDAWVKADAVTQLDAATRANGTRTLELLLTTDAARMGELRSRIQRNRERADDALQTLQQRVHLAEGRQLLAEIVTLRTQYVESFSRIDADVAADHRDQALERSRRETLPLLERLQERTGVLARLQGRIAKDAGRSVHESVQTDLVTVVSIGLAALALGAAFAWGLSRSITRPLQSALGIARRIAAGDLTVHIDAARRDEIGDLLRAMRDMNAGLAAVVGTVRANAESVACASSQIARGNLDLSQRTEEQASALQQTAASMEQLNSTVQQNADNARQADRMAQNASQVAGRGGDAVTRVVGTMQGIQDGSRRIGDIIGTIDGIAFQTNILALNAAVEAARAGEEGRGFAVVAAEVRSLAQRSAAAAREIKGLITANLEQVEQGSALAADAGATMNEVVLAIRRVSEIVGEISAASSEQSTGVGQVGEAVSQMDQVTQQNASLVEESAAAAESLRVQAGQLVQAVSTFRLQARPWRP